MHTTDVGPQQLIYSIDGDDCDGDGGGGGAGVGNPAAGFIQDIVSILNWIFNSNQQSSAATQTIAYSTDVQLKAQDGTSFESAGLDKRYNIHIPRGRIFLAQEIIVEPPIEEGDVWEAAPPAPGESEAPAPEESAQPSKPEEPQQPDNEHTKNRRPSSQEKHEQGQKRKKMDRPGGEKGDKRRPYRQRSIWFWINGGNNEV
ncbi:MAG: hypothetical protein WAM05_15350 [Candidatus Binataceae bacterium]